MKSKIRTTNFRDKTELDTHCINDDYFVLMWFLKIGSYVTISPNIWSNKLPQTVCRYICNITFLIPYTLIYTITLYLEFLDFNLSTFTNIEWQLMVILVSICFLKNSFNSKKLHSFFKKIGKLENYLRKLNFVYSKNIFKLYVYVIFIWIVNLITIIINAISSYTNYSSLDSLDIICTSYLVFYITVIFTYMFYVTNLFIDRFKFINIKIFNLMSDTSNYSHNLFYINKFLKITSKIINEINKNLGWTLLFCQFGVIGFTNDVIEMLIKGSENSFLLLFYLLFFLVSK